jgi:hypothetical protein
MAPIWCLLSRRSSKQCTISRACEFLLVIISGNELIGIGLFGSCKCSISLAKTIRARWCRRQSLRSTIISALDISFCLDSLFGGSTGNSHVLLACRSPDIVMRVIGYRCDMGVNHIVGEVAVYVAFTLLACIGVMLSGNSFRDSSETKFDARHGVGLVMASLSISLDSLGIGIARHRWGHCCCHSAYNPVDHYNSVHIDRIVFDARLRERL